MAGEPEGLQFDRAERESGAVPAAACAACKRLIERTYYTVGTRVVCERCRAVMEALRTEGSGLERFLRAAGLGALAAAMGAGIYFGIVALTGYEFGLVAIVVGLLVGGAVRHGARGRGGWAYQALAMALTYAAIVSTYIPQIVRSLVAVAAPNTPWGLVVVIAFAAPFLGGWRNIMGLIIIGIGLYQAWSMNRHVPVACAGPFTLNPS